MKSKILLFSLFFIIMAALPMISLNFHSMPLDKEGASDSTKEEPYSNNKELVINSALVWCESGDSDGFLKAMCVLFSNNIALKPEAFKSENNKKSTDDKLYKRISEAYNSVKEYKIYIESKQRYIPFSECSNGSTVTYADYPYIQAVACPFDCFSTKYNEQSRCVGVSIEGVRYLCENGSSAFEALNWFLPGSEIR